MERRDSRVGFTVQVTARTVQVWTTEHDRFSPEPLCHVRMAVNSPPPNRRSLHPFHGYLERRHLSQRRISPTEFAQLARRHQHA